MGGYVGKLFQEFAITVSVSLALSLAISLTLTPMLCARLLKRESREHGWLYRVFEHGFDALLGVYERCLKVALRHRFITLLIMLGTVALTGYLYVVIPKGFFPQQDTGMIMGIAEAAQDISVRRHGRSDESSGCCCAERSRRLLGGRDHGLGRGNRNPEPGAHVHCA